jgi:hypothetical protein
MPRLAPDINATFSVRSNIDGIFILPQINLYLPIVLEFSAILNLLLFHGEEILGL